MGGCSVAAPACAAQDVERECAAACASLAMPMPLNVSLRAEDLSQLQRHLLELLQQLEPPVPFTPSLKVLPAPSSCPKLYASHPLASKLPPARIVHCAFIPCSPHSVQAQNTLPTLYLRTVFAVPAALVAGVGWCLSVHEASYLMFVLSYRVPFVHSASRNALSYPCRQQSSDGVHIP